ncbi:MAG: hypothetical protein P8X74_09830 [Reinekea sp.]
MKYSFPLALAVVVLLGCSSKQVMVAYNADPQGSTDWFVIPDDAPSTVALQEPEVPRANIEVEQWQNRSASEPLSVERLTDSIGNVSLRLNRSTGASWELVSAALEAEEIAVDDRDRDQYRFDLIKERYGLSALFKGAQEALSLVLVPDNDKTLIVLEGTDDVTPDSDYAKEVLESLHHYFESSS